MVSLGRSKAVACRRNMATGTTSQPDVTHSRRCPCCPDGVTASTGVACHRGDCMRFGAGGRAPNCRCSVVTGRTIGSSRHPGMLETRRQPRRSQVTTGTLRISRSRVCNVISLGRSKAIAGIGMAICTGCQSGMIHRRRSPYRTDSMTTTAGIACHRCRYMRLCPC